ncbi:MAG TPA: SatD family protein [Candidatus Acidoferrales bacterium]
MKVSVLVADVVQSRNKPELQRTLTKQLDQAARDHLKQNIIRLPYAVTAGDEFQVIPRRIDAIPELILDLRRRFRPLDLRIGIGIGDVRGPIRAPVNRLNGTAFVLARQAIDGVKRGAVEGFPTLTAFRSTRKSFDRIANLIYGLHDTLLFEVTDTQWRTMNVYFAQQRVDWTARKLKVDISTASRNLKRSKYRQLASVANTMKWLIQEEWG